MTNHGFKREPRSAAKIIVMSDQEKQAINQQEIETVTTELREVLDETYEIVIVEKIDAPSFPLPSGRLVKMLTEKTPVKKAIIEIIPQDYEPSQAERDLRQAVLAELATAYRAVEKAKQLAENQIFGEMPPREDFYDALEKISELQNAVQEEN